MIEDLRIDMRNSDLIISLTRSFVSPNVLYRIFLLIVSVTIQVVCLQSELRQNALQAVVRELVFNHQRCMRISWKVIRLDTFCCRCTFFTPYIILILHSAMKSEAPRRKSNLDLR